MTERKIFLLKRKLQKSRRRLLGLNEEFAEPLKEMLFVAVEKLERISTNGACIYFDAKWLEKLEDTSLDFILCHELMHIKLKHIERQAFYKGDRYHLACDIIANSHLELLGFNYDKLPGIGKIYHDTFYPRTAGRFLTPTKALLEIPFDPSTLPPGKRRGYMIDSEYWWDYKKDRGESGVIVLSPDDEDDEETEECFKIGGNYKHTEIGFGVSEATDEKPKMSNNHNDLQNVLEILRKHKKDFSVDFVERIHFKHSTSLDWKRILSEFVQEELHDYSFTPPDRRLSDCDFFLPDYNVKRQSVKNVYFFADASGSIDDDVLSLIVSEIQEAIAQFDGALNGKMCYFDTRIRKQIDISFGADVAFQNACGGGGTDYNCIFDYVRNLNFDEVSSVIIFTDGEAEFPANNSLSGIPVLWLFTKETAVTPWGKYAYIK